MARTSFDLTPSVAGLARVFPGDVSAYELAHRLIASHSGYPGHDVLPELDRVPPDAICKPVDAWIAAVSPLFESSVKLLHGQLLVVGLALVDVDLGERLARRGVLSALVEAIHELPEAFTETGRDYLAAVSQPRDDGVPILGDRPTDIDQLGRAFFAEVLAGRLRFAREPRGDAATPDRPSRGRRKGGPAEGSFLVHIDGPWGAGKTSVLRLLSGQLRAGDPASGAEPWVVVWFNAWQHQRVAPPWWWLMTAVYRQSLAELWRLGDRRVFVLLAQDLGWRLRHGWMAYVLLPVAVVLVWFVWTTEFFGLTDFADKDALEIVEFIGSTLATVTGLALSVWGILRGVNRWLLFGSARGADTVLKRGHDPMEVVMRRYSHLVRSIRRPVAVLIDDLDRCQAPYVVELLEGIQTLFIEEPVTYVVAADKRWLSDSYAKIYKDFVSRADEPGRPLGYMFLEKTFQLSLRVPHLSRTVRTDYWLGLLRRTGAASVAAGDAEGFWKALGRMVGLGRAVTGPQDDDRARAAQAADAAVKDARSEDEVTAKVRELEGDVSLEAEELRKAAVRKLKEPEIERRTAHTLEGFAELLEDNPRAMKRFLNTYGVERDLQIRKGRSIGTLTRKRLALWTVMTLRWPLLTDLLARNPRAIAYLGNGADPKEVGEDVSALLDDPEVEALLESQEPSVRLTEESLRYILDLELRAGRETKRARAGP